jgi:hypothetical protein
MAGAGCLRQTSWPSPRPNDQFLAFHFDEVDHKVLEAEPDALAQAFRQRPVEAPFRVGITTFVQRHLDHDRIGGSVDPEVGPVNDKVAGRMLGEDLNRFSSGDLDRHMLAHRCSIVGSFAHGSSTRTRGMGASPIGLASR